MFVRRNSLMICWRGKRWTTAKGDPFRCPVNQTFCWISSISKDTNLTMKLKLMLSGRFECEQRVVRVE